MFGKKTQSLLADTSDQPRMSANVTEFMEKLGLSDEQIAEMGNPVSERQRAIDDSEAALATFVTQTNASWSQQTFAAIDLQPYRMIPESIWESLERQDRTLLEEVLGLLPAQPWNIVLLAMNDETATLTGVARFPTSVSEEATSAINLAGMSIVDELQQLGQEPGAAAARIIAMARKVAAASLGHEAVDQSRGTFFGD